MATEIDQLINSYIDTARSKRAQVAPAPAMTKEASASTPDLSARAERLASFMDKIASSPDEKLLDLMEDLPDAVKEAGKHKGPQGKAGKLKIQKETHDPSIGALPIQKETHESPVGNPPNQDKQAGEDGEESEKVANSPTPSRLNTPPAVRAQNATNAANKRGQILQNTTSMAMGPRPAPAVKTPVSPTAVAQRKTAAEEQDPGVVALAHLHQLKLAGQELTEEGLAKIATSTGLDTEDVLDLADEVFGASKTAGGKTSPTTSSEENFQNAVLKRDRQYGGGPRRPGTPRNVPHTPESEEQFERAVSQHRVPSEPKFPAGTTEASIGKKTASYEDPAITALAHLHQVKLSGQELTNAVIEKVASASGLGGDDVLMLAEQVFPADESTEDNAND